MKSEYTKKAEQLMKTLNITYTIEYDGIGINPKTAIKNSIKAEYGNVYEYDYCYLLDTGSFIYNNNNYDIETTKDIDSNTYIKVIKADDNNNIGESLNLPLKNK